MDDESRNPIAAWVRAEANGSPEEGDRAFAAVACVWGRVATPDGLAARVAMVATPAVPKSGLWTSWWTRAGVAASLAGAGTMLALLPSDVIGALVLASTQRVAAGVDHTLWAVRAWMEMVGAIANPIAHAATAMGGVLMAPAPLAVIAVNVALAGGGLAALRRILQGPASSREWAE